MGTYILWLENIILHSSPLRATLPNRHGNTHTANSGIFHFPFPHTPTETMLLPPLSLSLHFLQLHIFPFQFRREIFFAPRRYLRFILLRVPPQLLLISRHRRPSRSRRVILRFLAPTTFSLTVFHDFVFLCCFSHS